MIPLITTGSPSRKIVNEGNSTVVANYPTLANFSLDITQLEIRYLDTFEMSLLESSDFLEFINSGTEIRLSLPSLWNSKLIGPRETSKIGGGS